MEEGQESNDEEPVSSYSRSSHSSDGHRADDDNQSHSSYHSSEEGENEMDELSEVKSEAGAEPGSKSTQESCEQEHFSSLHVFGLHIASEIKQQYLQSFHARLIQLVSPEALFVPELDALFTKNEQLNQATLPVMQGGIDYAK